MAVDASFLARACVSVASGIDTRSLFLHPHVCSLSQDGGMRFLPGPLPHAGPSHRSHGVQLSLQEKSRLLSVD